MTRRREGPRTPGAMRGVTLLELMIVVVIIGTLAILAYPNYREYAARAQRTEARAMLLRVAANQEKYYLQNATYASTMTEFGYASNAVPTETGKYEISITAGDTDGFVARADYQMGGSEGAKCMWFEIDERGTRRSGPMTPSECWAR
ncbi:MAG: type IV pilin protein [Gammaproteobacteria bacterium]|jgi:type IV pilus assembly protein PilE